VKELVVNPVPEIRSCGNAILLNPPYNHITMLRYFDHDHDDYSVPLLEVFAKSKEPMTGKH
jgi:hypothetical protein